MATLSGLWIALVVGWALYEARMARGDARVLEARLEALQREHAALAHQVGLNTVLLAEQRAHLIRAREPSAN